MMASTTSIRLFNSSSLKSSFLSFSKLACDISTLPWAFFGEGVDGNSKNYLNEENKIPNSVLKNDLAGRFLGSLALERCCPTSVAAYITPLL